MSWQLEALTIWYLLWEKHPNISLSRVEIYRIKRLIQQKLSKLKLIILF
jgi:hypothetical protein